MDRIKLYFHYSIVFLPEALLTMALLWLLYILTGYYLVSFFPACLIITASTVLLLLLLGKKQLREVNTISSMIRSIRTQELEDSGRIVFGDELKEVQEELRALYTSSNTIIENLKRLERVRTEFLGNVSHELRTPIFAIQGYLETLLDGAIDDERVNRNFIEKAARHTENLNNLLHDLIDISMIESGEMNLSFRYFGLREFLVPIIQEFQPMAEEKGLQLVLHPVNETIQVYGDKNKLRQVMVNLIQNAVKYTEEGAVEVYTEVMHKAVTVSVKDSGIGIAPNDQARIFERFYRVDKGRSREVGGTGLGLAIVKHIIEAHGGTVRVESETGRGSVFSFVIKR